MPQNLSASVCFSVIMELKDLAAERRRRHLDNSVLGTEVEGVVIPSHLPLQDGTAGGRGTDDRASQISQLPHS